MWTLLAGPLAGLASELIDNLFETEEEKASAKAKLLKLEQQGHLNEIQVHLSAILAEAQSGDPWTSRARPGFLYLMYLVIAFLVFVGAPLGVFYPQEVEQAAENMRNLLMAVPESLWWLFGAGYLGYTGARSFDKWRGGAAAR